MKKAGITIFSLIITLVIILLTVRGCSFSKKTDENVSKNNQNNVVLQGENNSSEKETSKNEEDKNVPPSTENSTLNSINKGVEDSEKADTGIGAEKVESNNSSKESKDKETSEGGTSDLADVSFEKIDEPILKNNEQIEALVAGKDSYILNEKSYAYSISIIFPKEGEYEIINYFCPKKTYDAVSSGESIKVDYQLDENGKISITSISK